MYESKKDDPTKQIDSTIAACLWGDKHIPPPIGAFQEMMFKVLREIMRWNPTNTKDFMSLFIEAIEIDDLPIEEGTKTQYLKIMSLK